MQHHKSDTGAIRTVYLADVNQTENIKADMCEKYILLYSKAVPSDQTVTALFCYAENRPNVAAFVCRLSPINSGAFIDPISLCCEYFDGGAMLIKTDVFFAVGKFFKGSRSYALQELSWRIRGQGHKIICALDVVYEKTEVIDEKTRYIDTAVCRLLFAARYGSFNDILKAKTYFFTALFHPKHFEGVRKSLVKAFFEILPVAFCGLFYNLKCNKQTKAIVADVLFKPEFSRCYRRVATAEKTKGTYISIIVRTQGRPHILKNALVSLCNQTYKNFEVIVCEDTKATCGEVIDQFTSLLDIKYISGDIVGRGANGNRGLCVAKGEYINFLDDDDVFFPEHIELMCGYLDNHPDCDMAYSGSIAAGIDENREIKWLMPMFFERIDIFNMVAECRIAIQSVMFRRTLYEQHGGLYENIDGNEDYGMWLKFLKTAKRESSSPDINMATSMFCVPADTAEEEKRRGQYATYLDTLFSDDTLTYTFTAKELKEQQKIFLAGIAHLAREGKLEEYLAKRMKY